MRVFIPYLNEEQLRLYAASEAKALGRGGKRLIEKELGISHNTINKGIAELELSNPAIVKSPQSRQRKEGGGRKKTVNQAVWEQIEMFIMPHTHGESQSPLQWINKSLRHIEAGLKATGISVSHRIIGDALKEHGFNLQSNRKRFDEKSREDIDAQFEFIQKKVDQYISEKQPVISVNAKKREDIDWVNVGITKDIAEFAVQSIRNWWCKMGICYHNNADRLLITTIAGDSNSSKDTLWKYELQRFANDTGMAIEVIYFPLGTSKWNKIEHQLFSYISNNWQEKPLVSYQVIVSLIAPTKTTTGLKAACEIDDKVYKTGIDVSDKQLVNLNICLNEYHGEWNYCIFPK